MGKFTDKLEPNLTIGAIFTIFFGILFALGVGGDRFLDLTVWSAVYTLSKAGWEIKKKV